jgi:ABC-2 type transport system permease protein
VSQEHGARLFGLGYRGYDGPRRAPVWALLTLGVFTTRRVLGIGRGARHKVLPGITLVIAYAPALVSVVVAALTEPLPIDDLITYGEYTFFIGSALALYASLVAPEALCPDRRSGLLGLYLAGPLDRDRYIAAKWLAVLATMLVITVGPLLFMLAAFVVAGYGPSVGGLPVLLLRILASGLVTAALYTSVSLAVSSFTARRAAAAIGIVLVLFVPAIVAGVAYDAGAPAEVNVAGLPFAASALTYRIFGETPAEEDAAVYDVSTAFVAGAVAAAVVAGMLAAWLRYRRIEAER